MDNKAAIAARGALAQIMRLESVRLFVRHEPDGIPAGELARFIDVPQNTMSAHLATLSRADLVTSERQSRSIIYRADLNGLRELPIFLLKDCCGGSTELCAPLIAELMPCCVPEANTQIVDAIADGMYHPSMKEKMTALEARKLAIRDGSERAR